MDRTTQPDGAEELVQVKTHGVLLEGSLGVPLSALGVILFAHGSGSSRHSPRNRHVALLLRQAGFATLLLDLLTAAEENIDVQTRQLRFDIDFLAERLLAAADWLHGTPRTRNLAIGCFGASTGAGAALLAASRRPELIKAVVSRGGRPDLAWGALAQVQAPTLLIVGGEDKPVIELNRQALAHAARPQRTPHHPGGHPSVRGTGCPG